MQIKVNIYKVRWHNQLDSTSKNNEQWTEE